MKGIVRHIAFLLTALLALCGVSACIHKEGKPGGEEPESDPQALFVLHISPVNTRADASTDRVAEKIQSLRVIAISKDDEEGKNSVIEINRKVTFDNVVAVEEFGYSLTWRTRAGKKDFYIFANEESVGSIQFTEGTVLPEDLKDITPTLTQLLDCYPAAFDADLKPEGTTAKETEDKTTSGENASSAQSRAANFNAVINAVYFAPTYEIQENEGKRTVYLPYTTFYGNVNVEEKETQEDDANRTADDSPYPMFLVPVATKFTFHFTNYRSNPVEINEITVDKIHSDNFLLAHVGSTEEHKDFDGTTLWWVDWLAKVSEASHEDSDNTSFNKHYGWIADYALPAHAQSNPHSFVQREGTSGAAPYTVACKDETSAEPGKCSLGPFYLPESRNEVTYDTTVKDENGQDITQKVTEQIWYLTLRLHDTTSLPGANPLFDMVPISNLKALFRNTSVIIDITLREGDVEIYAEIHDWNEKFANGWVTGGEDSAPLPDDPGQLIL